MRDAVAPGGHDRTAVGVAVGVALGAAVGVALGGATEEGEGDGAPLGWGVSWPEAVGVGEELLAMNVGVGEEPVSPKNGKRPNTPLTSRRSARTTTAATATVMAGKLGDSLMACAPAVAAGASEASKVPRR